MRRCLISLSFSFWFLFSAHFLPFYSSLHHHVWSETVIIRIWIQRRSFRFFYIFFLVCENSINLKQLTFFGSSIFAVADFRSLPCTATHSCACFRSHRARLINFYALTRQEFTNERILESRGEFQFEQWIECEEIVFIFICRVWFLDSSVSTFGHRHRPTSADFHAYSESTKIYSKQHCLNGLRKNKKSFKSQQKPDFQQFQVNLVCLLGAFVPLACCVPISKSDSYKRNIIMKNFSIRIESWSGNMNS